MVKAEAVVRAEEGKEAAAGKSAHHPQLLPV